MSELEREGAQLGFMVATFAQAMQRFEAAFRAGVAHAQRPRTPVETEARREALRVRAYEQRIEHERRMGRLHVMQLMAEWRCQLGLTPDGRRVSK